MSPLELGCNSGGLTTEVMEILSRDKDTVEKVTYVDLGQRDLTVVPQFLQRFTVRFRVFSLFPCSPSDLHFSRIYESLILKKTV